MIVACPRCAGPMRIVAFITQSVVIDQILTHLRTRATSGDRRGARSHPRPARESLVARAADRPRAQRPSTHPEVPQRRPAPPGSRVGAVRRARRSHIGPASRGDDPPWGPPDDPRRGQTGDPPPGPHAGWWRGVKRRALLPDPD